jgi:hypothetical protein
VAAAADMVANPVVVVMVAKVEVVAMVEEGVMVVKVEDMAVREDTVVKVEDTVARVEDMAVRVEDMVKAEGTVAKVEDMAAKGGTAVVVVVDIRCSIVNASWECVGTASSGPKYMYLLLHLLNLILI